MSFQTTDPSWSGVGPDQMQLQIEVHFAATGKSSSFPPSPRLGRQCNPSKADNDAVEPGPLWSVEGPVWIGASGEPVWRA